MVWGAAFLLPAAGLFAISFWSVRSFRLQADFTFAAYARVFGEFGPILVSTLAIAASVAALCTALGFAFAYALRFRFPRSADALLFAVLVTLFGGYLVKVYAWKSILGVDGLLNALLVGVGALEAPSPDFLYNAGAVVVALTHFLLPFAILPIHAALRNVPDATVEAARDLGAGEATRIRRVVLPQIADGLLAAFAITFLAAAGDYVTPLLLGGGSGQMLGQFIAIEFSTRFNWPAGAAMSFTLLGACALALAAAYVALAPRRRR
jgi:spermidine/putrescine transport system permease protein